MQPRFEAAATSMGFASPLLLQLSLGTLMVVLTISVHLIGLAGLVRVLRSHRRLLVRLRVMPLVLLLCAALGLVLLHTIEIWIFAAFYLAVGALADFESALYFSTVTYSTIGYGDVVMAKSWRILGAMEGAAGIIMLGWSTAFLVSLLSQLRLSIHDWLTPQDRERRADEQERR
jgi:voltage-gated potassium channel